MAYTLDALTLPYQTELRELNNWSPVRKQQRRTLGGAYHYVVQAISAGRPLTLECRDGVAWWADADLTTLQSMAASATTHILTWDSDTYTVIFDYEAGPFAMQPALPFSGYWFGTVHLREVNT